MPAGRRADPLDRLPVAQVGADAEGSHAVPAEPLDGLVELGLPARHDHHLRAGPPEGLGDGEADAGAAAGHEGAPAGEGEQILEVVGHDRRR